MDKLKKLTERRRELKERIKHLENDLKKPLNHDLEANALEEEDREFLNGLYRIEKENLAQLEAEIIKTV